jgi:pyruvate dehydrogenase E2 component (dihydrolipoamide acetyltransferase)
MSTIEVKVPDIGDFKEVEVIEVLVKPGDAVVVDQSLLTVESDKASMEIPSSSAGVVKSVAVKLGDKVAMGSVIVVLESEAATASGLPLSAPPPPPVVASVPAPAPVSAPALAAAPVSAPAPASSIAAPTIAVAPETVNDNNALPHASPSVRKFARELGVDLYRVVGSGEKGRITPDDIRGFVKQAVSGVGGSTGQASQAPPSGSSLSALGIPAWPQVDFAKFGPVTTQPLPRIKKISGPALHRNWVMIPHVTNHDDADVTELEAFRIKLNQENEKAGLKLTMLAFLIKACVAALKKFPDFNSSLDGDQLVFKQYYHIGFAADTPTGLVVPVIRDADKKGLFEIATESAVLAKKARDGKLSPTEMQGGTFSISSLGGIGGTYFTPIINAPEVAILGVCRTATKPVWNGASFEPRLILPMSLSWDHRVVDGASAARFNAYLASVLADFRRVML